MVLPELQQGAGGMGLHLPLVPGLLLFRRHNSTWQKLKRAWKNYRLLSI